MTKPHRWSRIHGKMLNISSPQGDRSNRDEPSPHTCQNGVTNDSKCCGDVEKGGLHCRGEVTGRRRCKHNLSAQTIENRTALCPGSFISGMYQKEIKTLTQKCVCTLIYIFMDKYYRYIYIHTHTLLKLKLQCHWLPDAEANSLKRPDAEK